MLRGKKQSAMGEAEKGITGQDYKRHKETSGSDVAFFLSICGNKAFFFFLSLLNLKNVKLSFGYEN